MRDVGRRADWCARIPPASGGEGGVEVKSCPRCGAKVEVYRDTCDCGFSWASQSSTDLTREIQVPGEYRPVYAIEQPRRSSTWPWVLAFALLGLSGWHVYCTEKIEASIHEYITSHVGESPVDATIEVHVQPITNLVAIDLTVVDKGGKALKPADRLLLDAGLSYIRSEVEPYFERELTLVARKQVDPYAMALPYRLAFSLEISPKR
jgi:hypothetical protein